MNKFVTLFSLKLHSDKQERFYCSPSLLALKDLRTSVMNSVRWLLKSQWPPASYKLQNSIMGFCLTDFDCIHLYIQSSNLLFLWCFGISACLSHLETVFSEWVMRYWTHDSSDSLDVLSSQMLLFIPCLQIHYQTGPCDPKGHTRSVFLIPAVIFPPIAALHFRAEDLWQRAHVQLEATIEEQMLILLSGPLWSNFNLF